MIGEDKRSKLAVVISDDGSIEVLPTLRPQISRKQIREWLDLARELGEDGSAYMIEAVVAWLDTHRFYLNEEQCREVNVLMKKFAAHMSPLAPIPLFKKNADMDDSYLLPDDAASSDPPSSSFLV